MAQAKRGCLSIGFVLFVIAFGIGAYFALRWYREKLPPPPSGGELRVHILDVDQGDSILIISPEGKAVLIDAGANGKGQIALDAMNRYGVKQLDYLIVSNAQVDHAGGCDEVLRGIKVLKVIDADIAPPESLVDETGPQQQTNKRGKPQRLSQELPTVISYRDFRNAVRETGALYEKAEAGKVYDVGGGTSLTVLAPTQPLFTRGQMGSGGHVLNANSVVVRLDYGAFSMLLPGEAEAQTEERLIGKNANLQAVILKVAHHGSKYATSEEFIKRVNPQIAIISTSNGNRYGHPSQIVLDRLKAAKATVYRTDLQGEITINTTGKAKAGGKLYEIKTSREAKSDVWKGREAQKDDSSRTGFVSYGDYEPPKREKKK